MKPLILALVVMLCSSCATAPIDTEATREIVLEYVGHEVGTSGPFSKHAKRELAALSAKDRGEAMVLMERGAVGFLIIERNPALPNRIVLIARRKVVGDFPAAKDEPGR